MLACKTDLKHHDPFEKAKLETCESGKKSVSGLIRALCPLEKLETQEQMWKNFHSIMQVIINAKMQIVLDYFFIK